MHQRTVLATGGGTLTDTLHIAWTVVTVMLMFSAIGSSAMALGTRFRIYSIVSVIVLLAFGSLPGMASPALQVDLPTPLLGVWERISIGAFMVWVAVLATTLLRTRASSLIPGSPERRRHRT